MRKCLAAALAMAVFVMFTNTTLTPRMSSALVVAPHLCRHNLPIAVEQFVHREFPGQIQSFAIQAFNEVRCERSEKLVTLTKDATKKTPEAITKEQERIIEKWDDMANIAVTVVLKNRKIYHTTVHIHFSHDGSLVVASPEWNLSRAADDWRTKWCQFIYYVYRDELKEQNCLTP